MADQTPQQLYTRANIIQSHKLFSSFLNANIVNAFIHLFDNEHNMSLNANKKIIKYIEAERKLQGLDDSNVSIVSEVYGDDRKNPTLYLGIKKNNKEFIHLTIHLLIKYINPNQAGTIHMYKNIYTPEDSKIKRVHNMRIFL